MNRTMTFYRIGAAVLVTDIISTLVGSWLLSKDLWLPFIISTPIILLSLLILFFIPETFKKPENRSLAPSAATNENAVGLNVSIKELLPQAFVAMLILFPSETLSTLNSETCSSTIMGDTESRSSQQKLHTLFDCLVLECIVHEDR